MLLWPMLRSRQDLPSWRLFVLVRAVLFPFGWRRRCGVPMEVPAEVTAEAERTTTARTQANEWSSGRRAERPEPMGWAVFAQGTLALESTNRILDLLE